MLFNRQVLDPFCWLAPKKEMSLFLSQQASIIPSSLRNKKKIKWNPRSLYCHQAQPDKVANDYYDNDQYSDNSDDDDIEADEDAVAVVVEDVVDDI